MCPAPFLLRLSLLTPLTHPRMHAYATQVPYKSFWLKYPTKRFLAKPHDLITILRAIQSNSSEMDRRRKALASYRADLLYDEPHSRVGSNFLEAVRKKCSLPCGGGSAKRNETAADQECLRKAGL